MEHSVSKTNITYVVFHTSFITSTFIDLYKKDLDDPSSGVLSDNRFELPQHPCSQRQSPEFLGVLHSR